MKQHFHFFQVPTGCFKGAVSFNELKSLCWSPFGKVSGHEFPKLLRSTHFKRPGLSDTLLLFSSSKEFKNKTAIIRSNTGVAIDSLKQRLRDGVLPYLLSININVKIVSFLSNWKKVSL